MALTLSSPAFRLLLAFFLSFSLFTLYGRFHFYRDPGSVFYDQSRAFERKYSLLRQTQVEQARHAAKADAEAHNGLERFTSRPNHKASPELCVSMTTVKRDGLERQYVEDAVLSMLDGITQQERSSFHLNLLFTDLNQTDHPSWHLPWLRSLIDDVWSYDSHKTSLTPGMHSWLQNMTSSGLLRIKATMDYTFALQRCLDETEAPYIAVFEGDILLSPGWVAPTLRALRSANQLMQRNARAWFGKARHAGDWMDVRLFNQERSTGWSSRHVGENNELAIILPVDLAIALVFILFRRRHTALQRYLDNPSLLVIILLIVPISIVTFYQAGKASLLAPSPGLVVENFGCCSQALIFNRMHVASLIDYLQGFALNEALGKTEHKGYDMRCRDYAFGHGLDRLALYPVQAQHLGVKSATGTTNDEAQSVWSMAFEDLKPSELKARHDQAMYELYGPDWENTNEAFVR